MKGWNNLEVTMSRPRFSGRLGVVCLAAVALTAPAFAGVSPSLVESLAGMVEDWRDAGSDVTLVLTRGDEAELLALKLGRTLGREVQVESLPDDGVDAREAATRIAAARGVACAAVFAESSAGRWSAWRVGTCAP